MSVEAFDKVIQAALKKLGESATGRLSYAEWKVALDAVGARGAAFYEACQGGLAASGRGGAAMFASSGGAGAIVAGALPVIGQAAVFAALGAPYYEARLMLAEENTQSGFSQGWVMGLLDWDWPHVVARFGRKDLLRINAFDESTDVIRVEAYNRGLKAGYLAGRVMPDDGKKVYLNRLRLLAGVSIPVNWTRVTQIAYVIELAGKARIHLLKS